MRCLFINRQAAADRRRALEASFAATAPSHWDLLRVEAVEADDIADPRGLTPAERACWLSHRKALEATVDDDEDVLVVEDDTRFCRRTFSVLPAMLAQAADCDLLLSEVMPTDIKLLADLARRWNGLTRSGQFLAPSLAQTPLAGASAYMVRGPSKAKLLGLLAAAEVQAAPYDIALRELARSGRLHARFCFPFLTAPGAEADRSSIQGADIDLRQAAFHAFRRLMFVERDLDASRAEAAALTAAHGDEGAALAGQILGAIMSGAFPDTY